MASSSSLIGGHALNRQDRSLLSDHHHHQPCPSSSSSYSVTIPRHHHHHRARGRIVNSASLAITAETKTIQREWRSGSSQTTRQVQEKKVDAWMIMSAKEIVLSLKDAPLLLHVYGGDQRMTMETRKRADRGDWAELMTGSTAPLPDGVIFVKELTEEDDNDDYSVRMNSVNKMWGLVVQGRGCGPICYLLKTCRVEVGSGCGPNVACIRYMLLRVKDFREKASSQFMNCWLVECTGPPPYSGICFG